MIIVNNKKVNLFRADLNRKISDLSRINVHYYVFCGNVLLDILGEISAKSLGHEFRFSAIEFFKELLDFKQFVFRELRGIEDDKDLLDAYVQIIVQQVRTIGEETSEFRMIVRLDQLFKD